MKLKHKAQVIVGAKLARRAAEILGKRKRKAQKGIALTEATLTARQLNTKVYMGSSLPDTIGSLTFRQLRVALYRVLVEQSEADKQILKAYNALESIIP